MSLAVAVAGELLRALAASGLELRRDEPLALHTTLAVGGPTPLFLRPRSAAELAAALELLAQHAMPYRLLGAGSNLLVDDAPLPFAVVCMKTAAGPAEWHAEGVTADAGAFLPALAREAAERGLAGLEFAIGIPGSLGGAIRMNAGACGAAIEDSLSWVDIARPHAGGLVVRRALPGFRYRGSDLAADEIVLRAGLALEPAQSAELLRIQAEHIAARRRTQPTASRSAGCMFKNPPGDSAGRLIDRAGLKGSRVGAAEVSELHGNFVLNRGGAKASDVRELIARVKREIEKREGVLLEEEVVAWSAEP